MTSLIISLTSIPPRFKYIQECLNSLLAQTAEVSAINLYVPRGYKRFPCSQSDFPELANGVNLRLVDEDLGPATKILPACCDYQGEDAHILFCDDDKIYDPEWAQRFLDASKEHPECVICERGGHLSHPHYANNRDWISPRSPQATPLRRGLRYRARRMLSLGQWKALRWLESGYVDILEGWGGVLVRPEFFKDFAWEIPDILWTVDDIWLSGCLEIQGIPIWLNAASRPVIKETSDEVEHAALRNLVYKGRDRKAANKECIAYFRQNYGIWGGGEVGVSRCMLDDA
jgi:glycosyltransferase involved in cell wall biosynthesis